jgi:hypothetical protein
LGCIKEITMNYLGIFFALLLLTGGYSVPPTKQKPATCDYVGALPPEAQYQLWVNCCPTAFGGTYERVAQGAAALGYDNPSFAPSSVMILDVASDWPPIVTACLTSEE